MTKRLRRWRVWGLLLGVGVAAFWAACSSSTSPPVGTPCPTYTGDNGNYTTLAGTYNLVSLCQDTQPAHRPPAVTGSLRLTAPLDSFIFTDTAIGQPRTTLSGVYTLSHDTLSVNASGIGAFTGTFTFSAGTLYVSGSVPSAGGSQAIAIVFK